MKKQVLFIFVFGLLVLLLSSCTSAVKECTNPQGSTGSPEYYCDFPKPPQGLQHVVAWMTALTWDNSKGDASVEVDYLRMRYSHNGKMVTQYADEYNDIKKYTDWTYGSNFPRSPWYSYDGMGELKDGSYGTKIKNGKLYLPVSSMPDRIWHPVSSAYPIKEVPTDIDYFVIEVKFTIKGQAQVQVGFDGWPTSVAGVGQNREFGASDWYCESKTYELEIKFDKKTRYIQ